MSLFRLDFSGDIRKSETKNLGGKQMVEIQLCRKNFGKEEPATFTWIRVAIWEPKEWQLAQLQTGKFISGSGELTARSYVAKDGGKGVSLDVRCTSFDIDGARTDAPAAKPQEASAPRVPTGGAADDVPFACPLIAEVWG